MLLSPLCSSRTIIAIDFDHEWELLGNDLMRVFKDGVPSGTLTTSTIQAGGDQFGKRKADILGHFDLKNFKLYHGGHLAPTLEVDCPMAVNACDLGPHALGGTTANMTLPSCPP